MFVDYINSHAYNPEGPIGTFSEPDLLLVSGLAIDSRDLDILKNNIKRPIVFAECEFNSPDFFNGHTFQASIYLRKCFLSNDRNQPDVLYQCRFNETIGVYSPIGDVNFQNCVFGGDVLLTERTAPLTNASLTISECRFIGEEKSANAICTGDLYLKDSEIRKRLTIHAGGSVYCTALHFYNPSVIKIPESTFLRLEDVSLYSELFIQGGYTSSRRLRLQIDGLVWFVDGRMHFNNVYLGALDSTSYRFENATILNCWFADLGNRVGLELERDWRSFVLPAHTQTGGTVVTRSVRPDDNFGPTQRLELLRDCYRNLKINFDRSGNYPMANNFHAGELWAQWQLDCLQPRRLQRTLRRYVSWHALYYWMSEFGQSWKRPLLWLFLTLILATGLYAVIGFYPAKPWDPAFAGARERVWQGITLGVRRFAFWARFDGLTPLRPFHWMGWIVAFLQTSVTFIAAAFFLLALRRRFKR